MKTFLSSLASRLSFAFAISLVALVAVVLTVAQTTISTGSIQGTVTDPSGAFVSGAKVTIRNVETNQANQATTNSAGTFASGALIPGQYIVRIAGF